MGIPQGSQHLEPHGEVFLPCPIKIWARERHGKVGKAGKEKCVMVHPKAVDPRHYFLQGSDMESKNHGNIKVGKDH